MADLKAIRKVCPACKRRMPKKRTPVKLLVNGVMTWPDGRQKCVTKKAWRKRREEVWERDGGMCVHCHHALQPHEAHIHHIRKRSVGRNDVLGNLLTLCPDCHRKLHERHP